MSEKFQENCRIISQDRIGTGIFSMWLHTGKIAEKAKAGQFISLYCADGSRLLPRPISICEIRPDEGRLRIVYRVAGGGTEEFSYMRAGETVRVMGPLGNGFPTERTRPGMKALLIGGGIGLPPLVELGRQLSGEVQVAAGFRDERFLEEELGSFDAYVVATEDGSAGTKGNVLDAIREQNLEADIIYACGPTPMLRALKAYAQERKIECWLSLEERMACGVGACLACVCKSKEVDGHTHVHNKRVCKEGPVFLSTEVEI